MINGLGVVGWGVGGIEAEAGMLGQPVYFLTPEVVGRASHRRAAGRRHRDGPRAARHADAAQGEGRRKVRRVLRRARRRCRSSIARRSPTWRRSTARRWASSASTRRRSTYLRGTGRSEELCETFENYYKAQGLWGIPRKGEIDYTVDLELDLGTVVPGVAGPKRPQDRIELPELKKTFEALFEKPVAEGGYGKNDRRSRC